MVDSPFDLIEGDIGTVISIPIVDENGDPVDITGAAIVWHWQHDRKAPTTKAGTEFDGPGGDTRYTTVADDVEAGNLRIQVELTLASGWHGRTDPVFLKVGRKLQKGI